MSSHKSPLIGKPAPDFDATTTDGKIVKASDFWHDKLTVLVFLRHLGCTFCRTQVIELARAYPKFQDMNAQVVCVSMGPAVAGKAFKIMFELPFPMLMTGEDNTKPYELFGLGKGSWGQLLGIASWVNGFKAMATLKTKTIGTLAGDGRQMPGTFIIDTDGIVKFAYINQNASDNPATSILLSELSAISGGVPINDSVPNAKIGTN
jgi:peroxiredoxin